MTPEEELASEEAALEAIRKAGSDVAILALEAGLLEQTDNGPMPDDPS